MKAASVLLALASLLALAAPTQAQLLTAYLSNAGKDSNPCTDAKPCRYLPAALNAVADGGQIWIVDSGDFNTSSVSVGKSVSILALPGQSANVVAIAGAPAMTISAPGATVALRNLTFTDNPSNHGQNGVTVTAAAVVSVENCLFANLHQDGLVVIGTAAFAHVSNTTFRNVNGWAVASWNGPTVNVANSRMLHTEGAFVFSTSAGMTSTMSITDSIISDGTEGVFVSTNHAGATAQASVTRSTIFGTTYALDSEASLGTTLVTVSNSAVTHNQQAFTISGPGASVKSLGNNDMTDNVTETGTLTTAALR